jgi:hypothetical protein
MRFRVLGPSSGAFDDSYHDLDRCQSFVFVVSFHTVHTVSIFTCLPFNLSFLYLLQLYLSLIMI